MRTTRANVSVRPDQCGDDPLRGTACDVVEPCGAERAGGGAPVGGGPICRIGASIRGPIDRGPGALKPPYGIDGPRYCGGGVGARPISGVGMTEREEPNEPGKFRGTATPARP
jgi:hypothetical protein